MVVTSQSGGDGYGIYNVTNGSRTTVNGGIVQNSHQSAGRVGLYNKGTVSMTGGKVYGQETTSGTIGIHNEGGTVNQSGGHIGGWNGIRITSGTLNLSGGDIDTNAGNVGGGIGVYGSSCSSITINISGSFVLYGSMGISALCSGTMTVSGGTITGENGSAITFYGNINVSGGTIQSTDTDCWSESYCSNVGINSGGHIS